MPLVSIPYTSQPNKFAETDPAFAIQTLVNPGAGPFDHAKAPLRQSFVAMADVGASPVGRVLRNSTRLAGFYIPSYSGALLLADSTLLWHGIIAAGTNDRNDIVGRCASTNTNSAFARDFSLFVTPAGLIGVRTRNSSSAWTTYTTALTVAFGKPLTIMLLPGSSSIEVVSSVGAETISISGWAAGPGAGDYFAPLSIGCTLDFTGEQGHDQAQTALLAWSPRRLPRSLIAKPWQVFAPRNVWVPQAAGLGGVTGASAGTLPVAATSAGAVAVSGLSSQAISLEGASTATAPIAGASAATVALIAASAGQSLISCASAGTVELTGSATGTTTGAVSGESAQTISLAGVSAGQVLVGGASAATVTMTGSATGTAAGAWVIGQSVGQIIVSGISSGSVRVSAASDRFLTLDGNAAGIVDGGAEVLASLASRSRARDIEDSRPAQLATGRRTNSSTGNRPRQ